MQGLQKKEGRKAHPAFLRRPKVGQGGKEMIFRPKRSPESKPHDEDFRNGTQNKKGQSKIH